MKHFQEDSWMAKLSSERRMKGDGGLTALRRRLKGT